jgi:hypothetical protein
MVSLPWKTWERLIIWFAVGMIVYFGYGVYHSKLGPGSVPGETRWSRALKVSGLAWMILGSLVSILWLGGYRQQLAEEHAFLRGAGGWLIGCAGLLLSLSIGTVLNLIAQVSDHIRDRPHSARRPPD